MMKKLRKLSEKFFTLFSQGYGKTAIARMLNDREYQTLRNTNDFMVCVTSSLKRKTVPYGNIFAISDMLVNEIYIGNMVQGKYGAFLIRQKQNKPRPKKTSGTELRVHMSRLLTVSYGIGFKHW